MPTVARLITGAYVDIDPVGVIPAADTERLRRGFSDAIAQKNAVIPPPPKDKWPQPVLLKYADVKSWSAFARRALMWSIEEVDGSFQIIGYCDHPDGYWVQDPRQKIEFLPGSSAASVIDRMIAVLQDAAQK